MSLKDWLGISLSGTACLVFAGLLVDVLRSGGKVTRRRHRASRWSWVVLLSISFLGGLYGLRLPGSDRGDTSERVQARPVDTRRSTLRLPFYVLTKEEKRTGEATWSTVERAGALQLPWTFIACGLAYMLLGRGSAGGGRQAAGGRATATGDRLSLG